MAERSAPVTYMRGYEEDKITRLKFEVKDLAGDTEKLELPIYKDER